MISKLFLDLGLTVLERGWLSSNNILFAGYAGAPSTVIDTGYDTHKDQTAALVRSCLGQEPLQRILNTHLHSDHCGGNWLLQKQFAVETWVPEPSFDPARNWDHSRLSFEATDQTCHRFAVDRALRAGDSIQLGPRAWNILSAPGHDPEAVMLFEPHSRVLISGDALWESRLAIVFPELMGASGFHEVRRVLSVIEALQPSVVIPGHGSPFDGVAQAIGLSRARLALFEAAPERHSRHAARALLMFHMLEHRERRLEELHRWLISTPVFVNVIKVHGDSDIQRTIDVAAEIIDSMIRDRLLCKKDDLVILAR